MSTKETTKEVTEEERIDKWRRKMFREMLPEEISDTAVERLVVSYDVSPHDLILLLGKGCAPQVAIEILV